MGKTISFVVGDGHLRHNNRTIISSNVDPTKTSENVVLIQQSLKDAYEKLFGEALQKYNDKQKRNDRKIDSYYEHIRTGKNGQKLFHEIVAQVGNRDDTGIGTADAEIAIEILKKYYYDFIERNPYLYVFNAVIHVDEPQGTPHLHLDFIPFGTGYKQGLEVQNSMRKAMELQGYKHQTIALHDEYTHIILGTLPKGANTQWADNERKALGALLESYNIDWDELGTHRKNLSVKEYKAMQESLERTILSTPTLPIETREPTVPMKLAGVKTDEVLVNLNTINAVMRENALLRTQADIDRKLLLEAEKQKEDQSKYIQRKLKECQVREDKARKVREQFDIGIAENYNAVLAQNDSLMSQVHTLNIQCSISQKRAEESDKRSSRLQAEVQTIKEAYDADIQKAVHDATAPLNEEIAHLNAEIGDLQSKLSMVCHILKECIHALRAIFINDAPDNKYHMNPTKAVSRLVKACSAAASRVLHEADSHWSKDSKLSACVSDELQKVVSYFEKQEKSR